MMRNFALFLRYMVAAFLVAGGFASAQAAQQAAQNAKQASSAQAAVRYAERMRRAHELKAAIAYLQEFLAANGKQYDVLMELANVYAEQDDSTHEREAVVEALAVRPGAPEVNLRLGGMLMRMGNDPEAMDRFETVLSANPQDAMARAGELQAATHLATTMRGQGKPESALLALQHARTMLPDDPQLLLEIGIQQTELGQFSEALATLMQAYQIDPNRSEILYALAHAQFEAQQLKKAEDSLSSYLKLMPNDASAHFALGRAYEVEQRTDPARTEFERSIELQPVQTESYYELGDMDLDVGDLGAAEPLLRRVLERDPHHGGALTDMGRLCLAHKQAADAEQWLAKAVAAAPDYAQAHYQHAVALSRLGRKDEAERESAAAAKLLRVSPPGK